MAPSVYVAGSGPGVGKGTVALGLVELLSRQVARIGVFRPLLGGHGHDDALLTLLTQRYPVVAPYGESYGLTVAEAGAFGTFAGTVIDSLNAALRSAVAASGYGYEVADIPSVINVNAEGYTNISSLDIHPNGEGHELMGKYMAEFVAAAPVPVTPVTSEESEPVTEPATEPPVTTEAPAASAAATEAPETTAGEKRGCGSSVAAGILLAVLAGTVCLVKKRK